ncbi:MAG: MCE family protein, partial [Pirellulaceae bacterium]|nr:MCE family protein [Pirellulaceae bacterium]
MSTSDGTEGTETQAANGAQPIPTASIRSSHQVASQRWRTRLWWLTALCLIIALGVTISGLRSPGQRIVVHFRDGHGIKPGDTLRYRGIDVGAVTEVHLTKDLQGIDVHLELTPEHASIAVQGSRFWIERPRVRIGQVSGLETVLGAKYVGTIPGPAQSPPQQEFTGLENPLGMSEQESVDVRVRFPAGEGLATGDSVRYLGIDVGEITEVELTDQ